MPPILDGGGKRQMQLPQITHAASRLRPVSDNRIPDEEKDRQDRDNPRSNCKFDQRKGAMLETPRLPIKAPFQR